MIVHIFGAVSPPSCATFALLKTAEDNQNEYPAEVVDTVRQNFYVDDCLKSVSSVEQAAWLYRNLKGMCSKGGFHLNKSNHCSVLAIISEEERAKGVRTLNLDVTQWNYISSKLNPADIASCGLQIDAFLQSKTWIHGPEFLREPQFERPGHDQESDMISLDDPEGRNVVSVCAAVLQPNESPSATLVSHFSNWMDLKRAVRRILKYKELLKQLSQERVKVIATHQASSQQGDAEARHLQQFKASLTIQRLNTEDMANAEKAIICFVQRQSFQEEMASLEKGTVRRTSPLVKLDPVVVDGVLRVGGRLSRAALPEEAKHPAILLKASHIS